ncbi:MAG: hypothetical protein KME27_27505 [Lyngbya sp. HA4199-MV5]|nr:hypothetical protein [Lyngbya sp. HA4199-MV5]
MILQCATLQRQTCSLKTAKPDDGARSWVQSLLLCGMSMRSRLNPKAFGDLLFARFLTN